MSSREDSINLITIKEEFEFYRPYHIRNAKIVLVPHAFMERAMAVYKANGIPTTPRMMMDGVRLIGVERRGESDGK